MTTVYFDAERNARPAYRRLREVEHQRSLPSKHTTMATSLNDVSRSLVQIDTTGSFATCHTVSPANLRLDVKGVGRIRLPLTATQALELRAVARPARHGFKDQTRLDRRVRDTWEVPRSRISIDGRTWNRTILPQLDAIRRDLGLPDRSRLKAELHNMLVYEPGQFFVTHQDSEKTDSMIGTLVVILPSAFTGGDMVIRHHDEKVTFRASRRKLAFIAFYADCHHEVRPIMRGYRSVLTYNLILQGKTPTESVAPAWHIDALAQHVRRFFDTPPQPRWPRDQQTEPPDRLVYLLDHQYTQRGLAWNRLKNADAARASALREVARLLDCEIFLALADVHETWSSEDEDFGFNRYGRRRRWNWRDENDGHEDEDAGNRDDRSPALVDLLDSTVELRHWVGVNGRPEAVADGVDAHELCFTKASAQLEPFASEHEGYMGNWGNTVDRWYHRAAVVLWPRERTFVIRARASARWAIGEIARALKSDEVDEARGLTERLQPFWARAAQQERGRGFVERTLTVASTLDRPDLAASLLQPFTLVQLTPAAAPRLLSLLDRYGLDWCRTLLEHWVSDRRQRDPKALAAWIASTCPDLCRTLGTGNSQDGLELGRWLVREHWAWLVRQRSDIRRHEYVKGALAELTSLAPPTLGLIEGSIATQHANLHGEMIEYLTSSGNYDVAELAHLLRTARERYPPRVRRSLGLKPVHATCVIGLTANVAAPPRARDDWSIQASLRCRCALCATLARFLRSPEEIRFEWPLAKDHRAHIHQTVDANDLPVTHATRRTGRPFTLVLAKTGAVFDRDAAARKQWQRELKWMTKTGNAFDA